MTTVGVLGLGKLGLPLALVLAEAGHHVAAWDIDERTREIVKVHEALIDEPQVDGLLARNQLDLMQPAQMAHAASVIFIVVPTPSLPDGSFDASLILEAFHSIRTTASRRPVVAVVSTVSPGTCRKVLLPAASANGLRLAYTPVVIALGSVVRDLTNPELQLLGFSDQASAVPALARVLQSIAPRTTQHVMSYESAELTKLSANVFSAFKVSFANLMGRLCQESGADVDEVLTALAEHRRIGGVSLVAGAGFGGPCWPRDVHAFTAANGQLGAVVHGMNQEHLSWIVDWIWRTHASQLNAHVGSTYAVLGRAYKDGTNYRFDSFGDSLAKALHQRSLIAVNAREADVVVIAQPLRELNLCEHLAPGAHVYDLWRTHSYLAACDDVVYHAFGRPELEGS